MLARAVTDRDLDRTWPASAAALRTWDGEGLPSDALARTVAREMLAAHRAGTLNRVANRLNYDLVGSRSLLYTTADRLAAGAPGETPADLARIDPRRAPAPPWPVKIGRASCREGGCPYVLDLGVSGRLKTKKKKIPPTPH